MGRIIWEVRLTNGAVQPAARGAENKVFSAVFVEFNFAEVLSNLKIKYDGLLLIGGKVAAAMVEEA